MPKAAKVVKSRKTANNGLLNEMVQRNQQVSGHNMDGVMQKWGKQINAISEAYEGKIDDYKLLTTAILMENMDRHINHVSKIRGLNEATQPGDTSYFKRFGINLLAAVVPGLIAEDIVSVDCAA